METNDVTIAILVYERTEYFQEALESALSQTVQCPIIVCDNASKTDYFAQVCAKYPERVRYHRNATNIGMFGNYNTAVEQSTTEFTMILGDDDIMKPDYIENFLYYKRQYPDIGLYFTNVEVLHEPHKTLTPYYLPTNWDWTIVDMLEIKKYAVTHDLGIPSISSVIRTELMRYSPYENNILGSNDYYFIYHLSDKIKVYCNDAIQLTYRKHAKCSTSKDSSLYDQIVISGHLIVWDLAQNESFFDKIKWTHILHQHFRHQRTSFCRFEETTSSYQNVVKRLKSNVLWHLWPVCYVIVKFVKR